MIYLDSDPQIYIWSLETKKRSTAFSKCMCIYGKLYGLGKKTTPAWAFFAHQWANTNYISTTHELKRTEKHMVLIYPRFRTKFPVYENSPPNNLSDYKINFCVHQQIVQFDNVWLDISNLTFCRTNKYFYDPRKKNKYFYVVTVYRQRLHVRFPVDGNKPIITSPFQNPPTFSENAFLQNYFSSSVFIRFRHHRRGPLWRRCRHLQVSSQPPLRQISWFDVSARWCVCRPPTEHRFLMVRRLIALPREWIQVAEKREMP